MKASNHLCLTKLPKSALCGGLLCLSLFGAGCGSAPDNSPAVSITSPVANQTLSKGQPVDVRFTVSGVDASGPPGQTFKIASGETLVPGQGRVVAYFDGSNVQAIATFIPSDTDRFLVPGTPPTVGDSPSKIVLPGMRRITLKLFYNDNKTPVDPSRTGEVVVNIQ